MNGVFFGREQLPDGLVGVDCDDDYTQRPGKLVVVYCEMEDEVIPDTDNAYPAGFYPRDYESPSFIAREKALTDAQERIVCPVAAAWRGPASNESGWLYRYRPTEIVTVD